MAPAARRGTARRVPRRKLRPADLLQSSRLEWWCGGNCPDQNLTRLIPSHEFDRPVPKEWPVENRHILLALRHCLIVMAGEG